MNLKYYLIGFLFLNVIALTTFAQGNEKWISVKEDDEINYKIISFNEDLAEEYLNAEDIEEVFGNNAQVGAYRYYKIQKIHYYDDLNPDDDNNTYDGWIVDVGRSNWIRSNMWRYYNKPQLKTYKSLTIFANPQFLGPSFEDMGLLIPPYFIPDPVEDYLDDIDWYYEFKVKSNVVSHEFEEIERKELKMIYEFASNGFLLNQKLFTNKDQIIYEYSLEDEPIINIDTFLILLGILVFSILFIELTYIMLKKRLNSKDRLKSKELCPI